ncbi:MAG: hypothetical protein FJY95_11080 [Candidatus Handelsmanbacteria bacterium]|nr:hypothetical protein [Candidatus Handelsmanbacteria bacterium]
MRYPRLSYYFLAALTLLLAGAAHAQQRRSWAAPVHGALSDPARWSPAGVPSALDFVEIATVSEYTVSL